MRPRDLVRSTTENTIHLHCLVPPQLALAIKEYAAIMGMKPNQVVIFALAAYLADAEMNVPVISLQTESKHARRNFTKSVRRNTNRAKAGRDGAASHQ